MKNRTSWLQSKMLPKAVVLIGVFLLPLTYVHEIGHAIPCFIEGHEYEIKIGLAGGYMQCKGVLENQIFFMSFGGLFAAFVSIVPFFISPKWVTRNGFVAIAVFSFSIAQAFNAVLETTFYEKYMTDTFLFVIIMNLFQITIFFLLGYKFSKKPITGVTSKEYLEK